MSALIKAAALTTIAAAASLGFVTLTEPSLVVAKPVPAKTATATATPPIKVDPKNPCEPMPTKLVCYKNGKCFRVILPCNPYA